MIPSLKLSEKELPAVELSLNEIVRPIFSQLQQVEENLNKIGQESEGILKQSSHYVLNGGGKRLRASLVLFCAATNPGNGSLSFSSVVSESSVSIATAVELIHAATLVHDDIIDKAALRRLKPTVNVQFGEEVAVLLGDFLYARAFEIIASVGDKEVTEWMAGTTQKMCEGELSQLKHRYLADLSLEEYLSFIEKKTAALISVSARCGAKLARLSTTEQNALASFGMNMGIAYQIIDDLLDIVGSENRLGKTLRTDVGNGKMTLPLIFLRENLGPEGKEQFLRDFQSLNSDLKMIQSSMVKYKIADKIEQFSDRYFNQAVQSLQIFSDPVKKPLEQIARFILNRDY